MTPMRRGDVFIHDQPEPEAGTIRWSASPSVLRDPLNELVRSESAREDYGVAIHAGAVDAGPRRAELRAARGGRRRRL